MRILHILLFLFFSAAISAEDSAEKHAGWSMGQVRILQPNAQIVTNSLESSEPEGSTSFGIYCNTSISSGSEFWLAISTSINLGVDNSTIRVTSTVDKNDPVMDSWQIATNGTAMFRKALPADLASGFNGNQILIQFSHANEFVRATFDISDVEQLLGKLTDLCRRKVLPPAHNCVFIDKMNRRQFSTIRNACEKGVMVYVVDLVEAIPDGVWKPDAAGANQELLENYGGRRYNKCSEHWMFRGAEVWHHEVFPKFARRKMVDYCVHYDYSSDDLTEAGYETCTEFRKRFIACSG